MVPGGGTTIRRPYLAVARQGGVVLFRSRYVFSRKLSSANSDEVVFCLVLPSRFLGGEGRAPPRYQADAL